MCFCRHLALPGQLGFEKDMVNREKIAIYSLSTVCDLI